MKQTVPFRRLFLTLLLGSALLSAQPTTINVSSTVLQGPVKRLGINLGTQTFYDSGQMMKNLVFINPGFEGEVFQSVILCASGTASTCNDDNAFSGWSSNFWNGATFEFFSGSAQGRTGTITSFTAANGSVGAMFGLSGGGAAPGSRDYMIVRQRIPGNALAGWWPRSGGAGSVTTNTSDLPPGTTGQQTAVVTAPSSGDSAEVASYFDSTVGLTFLQLQGVYQLSFKAKGVGGTQSIAVSVTRDAAGLTHLNQTVNLTNNWSTYNLTFNAAESGSAIGSVKTTFATLGADAFLLDDVSLVQLNTDPTNPTAFRDPVVNALKTLKPGVLRFWFNQLGEPLDNLLADPFGRLRSGYSAFRTEVDFVSYSLPEFLQLCELLGAEPWMVVPTTFSPGEASNLIEYLAGGSNTTYGAKRAAAGHPNTWASSFTKIHLEFGNEAWNAGFKGGSIEFPENYGQRAQTIFGAMRANSSFVTAAFDLVLGGQAVSPARNQIIQNNCNNNDSFALAPYMMTRVDSFSTPEDLYGSTFAEAEAFHTNSGTAEGVANGVMLQNQQYLQATNHPKPIVGYEMNLSTLDGSITQTALNSYVSSTGAGLAVVDSMLQQMRQGVLTQNLFTLQQYANNRSDGKSVYLWGSVVDMGVTDRRRPQFHALQLANQAIASNALMLQTAHLGPDPTWNQALTNSVQLNGAHYLQSFAFLGGGRYSLVVFNLHRSSSLPVNFAGAIAPSGTVNMQQLTSSQISDNNEAANNVVPVSSTASNFNPLAILSLPPYSMTVMSWANPSNYAGYLESSACSGISGWAADKNRLNTPIIVSLVDTATGAAVALTTANGSRGDVGSLIGDNGLHGFILRIPSSYLNSGSHTFQVRYESSAQAVGTTGSLACGGANGAVSYTGYVDSASCKAIGGWAADQNSLNQSIPVSLWDAATGAQLATTTANMLRADVASLLGDNGLHGFSMQLPASYTDGLSHGYQVRFASSSAQIAGSPVTLTCGTAPVVVNYTGYVDAASCAGISGWAADKSRLNVPITVSLWDGGTRLAAVTANASRGDVGGVLGDNGLHGFSIPIPPGYANGVTHTLQLRYESSTAQLPGSPATLNCGGTATPLYTGYIDNSSCSGINGWAADKNRLNVPITISLWDGGTQVAATLANASRGDVGGVLGDNGQHGFSIPIPAGYANGVSRTLQVRYESSTTQLAGSPAAFTCGTSGTPNYLGFVDNMSCSSISGWAADRNSLNSTISVNIYDGGTLLQTLTAGGSRGDVGTFLGDNGLHGFGIPTPTSVKDGNTHVITVRTGSAAPLSGPQVLTCQ